MMGAGGSGGGVVPVVWEGAVVAAYSILVRTPLDSGVLGGHRERRVGERHGSGVEPAQVR